MLVALEKADEFDNAGMIDATHDLDLLQNVRTLRVVSPQMPNRKAEDKWSDNEVSTRCKAKSLHQAIGERMGTK